MADFPPNLEDGESWLPSDVFLEIISTTNASKVKNNDNNLLVRDHPTLKSSANVAVPEIQVINDVNINFLCPESFSGKSLSYVTLWVVPSQMSKALLAREFQVLTMATIHAAGTMDLKLYLDPLTHTVQRS
ncbi:hypothetical protein POTOM_038999 [Populus tomentosa]|uniref:Uncharacterized protein n=1 Tax=Populus tomentosa TaxID=118781 RepID=A0A8X7YY92_POPTO|nr:hypothetical protein POTOM_038999 [Populus tomentosa]